MSQHSEDLPSTAPKTEVWVIIMILAFAPVVAAVFVREPARMPLLAVGALTFVAGFVLMIRHSTTGTEGLRQLRRSDGD
ncbi:MAG TPA: hypothetical protein VM076_11300 [Gemmatimonadaceae bacterium]|nr:hypothetical protein [Gemmatimonadaceae bacterium]